MTLHSTYDPSKESRKHLLIGENRIQRYYHLGGKFGRDGHYKKRSIIKLLGGSRTQGEELYWNSVSWPEKGARKVYWVKSNLLKVGVKPLWGIVH